MDIKLKWEFAATNGYGYMQGAVLAADADRDGECEVFVGSFTYSLYCLRGKDGSVKWTYDLPEDRGVATTMTDEGGVGLDPDIRECVGCNNLSLADVDGDGHLEAVFGTEPRISVYALKTEHNVANRLLWKTPLVGAFIAGGLGCFTDTDGVAKVLALTRWKAPGEDGRAHLLDGCTGRMLWGPIGDQDICSSGPAVADVNDDGILEFVYGNHRWRDIPLKGHVVCRTVKDGALLWAYDSPDDTGFVTMPLCDVNNDGQLEVVSTFGHFYDVASPAYGFLVLSANDGGKLFEYRVAEGCKTDDFGAAIGACPNGSVICHGDCIDGKPVVTCRNGRSFDVIWRTECEGTPCTPLALDVNGDCVDDFIVGDSRNNIYILSGIDGGVLCRENFTDREKVTRLSKIGIRALSAVDVDNDGFWEILFNSEDGRTRCLATGIRTQPGAGREFRMQGEGITRLSSTNRYAGNNT